MRKRLELVSGNDGKNIEIASDILMNGNLRRSNFNPLKKKIKF